MRLLSFAMVLFYRDDEPKNMLLSLVSQLRIGMDLQKVALTAPAQVSV